MTYDANGNRLTYGNKTYTWQDGRELTRITDGGNIYTYTYDEDGLRSSKTVNGVTTSYMYNEEAQLVAQTTGGNTMYFQYDESGVPVGFIYDGRQYYYLTNTMGDVIGITDASGWFLVKYTYDAWGNVASIQKGQGLYTYYHQAIDSNPLLYRGYYYDTETQYYYLQSRYYEPAVCRFINADIPEVVQATKNIIVGTNTFAYCNNNPVNCSDPSGYLNIRGDLIADTIDGIIWLFTIGKTINDFLRALKTVIGKKKVAKTIINNIIQTVKKNTKRMTEFVNKLLVKILGASKAKMFAAAKVIGYINSFLSRLLKSLTILDRLFPFGFSIGGLIASSFTWWRPTFTSTERKYIWFGAYTTYIYIVF